MKKKKLHRCWSVMEGKILFLNCKKAPIYILNICSSVQYFNSTNAHLSQKLLYLYDFVYEPDDLFEFQTCRNNMSYNCH